MKFRLFIALFIFFLAFSITTTAQENKLVLLSVTKNSKCGYIDKTGNVVIALQFDDCWNFSEGFASVNVDGKQGFIDTKGNFLVEPQFDGFWRWAEFREGLAPVYLGDWQKSQGQWGFVNSKGQTTLLPEVTLLNDFHESLASFHKGKGENERAGYLNTELKVAIEPRFKSAGNFYDGRARVEDLDGSEYYIDKTGRKVFPDRDGSDFQDGKAFFKLNGKYGFINTDGETIIEPQFDDANHFGEDLAAVKIKDKWGFIDVNGKVVIKPAFDDAGEFNEGLASVAIKDKWGFIDKTGKVIIPFQFDKWTYWFEDGVCEVRINNKAGYIDKSGKYIWTPTN